MFLNDHSIGDKTISNTNPNIYANPACIKNSLNDNTPKKAMVSKIKESIKWAKALEPKARAMNTLSKMPFLCLS